jgi:hypothetical protein
MIFSPRELLRIPRPLLNGALPTLTFNATANAFLFGIGTAAGPGLHAKRGRQYLWIGCGRPPERTVVGLGTNRQNPTLR